MGRGQIVSADGEGAYRLKILYDRSRAEAEVERLEAEIEVIEDRFESIDDEIVTAETEKYYTYDVWQAKIFAYGKAVSGANLEEEEAELDAIIAAVEDPENISPTEQRDIDRQQAVVDALKEGVSEAKRDLETAQKDYDNALAVYTALVETKNILKLRKTACEKKIAYLNENLPADIEVDAWCADYNEELTGEVGTVEVGREDGTLYVIRPGGEDGTAAAYSPATDGQLQPIVSSTPSASFVNYALMPGVNRWKPRYRTGTITSLDGDTCALTLAPARSTHQNFDVNASGYLTGVPIEYMSCNGAAFEVGDEVIVELEGMDWTAPKVVGFVREPRACDMGDIIIPVRSSEYAENAELLLYIFDTTTNAVREIFNTGISGAYDIGETHDIDGGLTDSNLAIVVGGTTHNIYDYKYAMTQYYGSAVRRDYRESSDHAFNYANVSSFCDGEYVYLIARVIEDHIPEEPTIVDWNPILGWYEYYNDINDDGIQNEEETPCDISFIFEKRTVSGGTVASKTYYSETELLSETNCPLGAKKMCGNSANIFVAKETSENHFSPEIINKNNGELVADLSEHVDAIFSGGINQWPLDLACNDKWYVAIDYSKGITYVFDSSATLVFSGYIGHSSSHWNLDILYKIKLIGFNELGNLIVTTKHVYADKQTISYKIFAINEDGTPVFRRESPEVHLIDTRYQVVSNVVHCKKFRRDTGA